MSNEPLVTLPLSDYQLLIQRVNEKASHDLTIGRIYEIEIGGVKEIYYCTSKVDKTFHFVSGGIELKYIVITLNEKL